MKVLIYFIVAVFVYLIPKYSLCQEKENSAKISLLKQTPGLVAFWDFKEKEGKARKAFGKSNFPLKE